MHAARRYLAWLAGTFVVASAAVIGFVALVDPYGLYALADVPGMNRLKPPVERYRNEVRLARAERVRPKLVIVGNSRMEAGIDPDSGPLARTNAFNLALAGTDMTLAVGQLRALVQAGVRPSRVIAGVEFVDVLTATPVAPAAAVQLPAARAPSWRDRLWQLDALFSFASLKDAVATVALQRDGDAAFATLRGHNPLRQYRRIAAAEGYAALFAQRAAENARRLAGFAHGGIDAGAVHAQVAGLLDAAAEGDPRVDVDLVIYPYHAQLLALFEQSGLWPRFEAWKAQLVAEVDAARRRHPQARFSVLDFSGFGTVQCEAIPPAGGGTRWYWEAGHFKSALGEAIAARVLDQAAPEGFGVRLEATTLEANRQRIAAERARCVAAQPKLFAGAAHVSIALPRR